MSGRDKTGTPPADPGPRWDADPPPGPVAYLVKMFPRLSETFITNEVLELRRRGVDLLLISLLAPTGTVHSEEARALAGRTWYAPPLRGLQGWRSVLADHRWLLRRAPGRYLHVTMQVARRFSPSAWKRFLQAGPVARYCVENRVSHLHAGFAHVPASVAWWVRRLTRIHFSFAAHAKDLYLSDPESLKHKLHRARFAWTCTEANGEFLRALQSPTPVYVGYHGCDLTRFQPPIEGGAPEASNAAAEREPAMAGPEHSAAPPSGLPVVLGVGRLVPKKGFDDLLRAAALLWGEGRAFRLVLIGDGPERPRLELLAQTLGLNGNLRFQGSLAPQAVREAYAGAAVVALPSVVLGNGDRDGIPNVLVEAMAAGVPVVSTRVSAIPELIRHRESGLLVEPRAPAELAGALAEVLDDPSSARQRAERARRDMEERFDLSRNSGRLAELLQRHRLPTRCLYVSADFGIPVRGHKGASAHVRSVADGLARAGLEVRLLTPSPGPAEPEGNAFSLPMIEVPPPRWISRLIERCRGRRARGLALELRRLLYNFTLHQAVRDRFHLDHPDFVYERYSLCSIATGWLCRRREKPWLLEVNAPLADEESTWRGLRLRRLTRALERWCLRHADHVLVVSEALRAWAVEQGAAEDRVTVLGNGVDLSRFHPEVDGGPPRRAAGWTADEVVIGFVGSLKPWHGVGCLLEAFAAARARIPQLRLLVVGDGPQRRALLARVQELGCESAVHFTGALPHEQVPQWLRACDILAAPYLDQDRFYFSPLKVLEYLAAGRPVVASGLGEIERLVDPSCGRLVRPGDPAPLADALTALATDPGLRRRLGEEAARRARQHDWSDRVNAILRIARRLRLERIGYPEPDRTEVRP